MTISAFALLIADILILFLIFALNRASSTRSHSLIKLFKGIFICQFIWNTALILQILLYERLNIAPIYFDYITYIGIFFLPVFLFLAARTFTNPNFKIKNYHNLLFVIPVISTIVLWTNDLHNLFYVEYSFILSETQYGPYFTIHSLYTYGLLVISLLMLLRYSVKGQKKISAQTYLFLFAIAIPLFVNIIAMLGLYPLTIYATPISFTISMILLYLAIFRFDFLNINTIATPLIIDAISDGYVVLNSSNEITLANKVFLNIFNLKKSEVINKDISTIKEFKKMFSKDDLEVSLGLVKTTNKKITIEKHFEKTDQYFSIDISPILKKNTYVGTLLFFFDITEIEHDKIQIKADQDLLIEQERFASLRSNDRWNCT